MTPVFVDSSYFKALLDENDDFHKKALDIFADLTQQKEQLITTNYILNETLTLLRAKVNLEAAFKLRDFLNAGSPILTIYRVTSEDDVNAWSWFSKDWSKLSFTDCVSFAVMKRLEIARVATFDKHFTQAGFTIVS